MAEKEGSEELERKSLKEACQVAVNRDEWQRIVEDLCAS